MHHRLAYEVDPVRLHLGVAVPHEARPRRTARGRVGQRGCGREVVQGEQARVEVLHGGADGAREELVRVVVPDVRGHVST